MNREKWVKRFEKLEDDTYKRSEAYLKNLAKQFHKAKTQIEKDLSYWYEKFAYNNNVSYADAKKLLTKGELKEFKMTLAEYIEKSKLVPFNEEYITELENVSARVHVSRLQALEIQLQNTVEKLYAEYGGTLETFIRDEAETSYYSTAYEMAKGSGIAADVRRLNEEALESYVKTPWCKDKKIIPQRLRGIKDELNETIKTEVTQNLIVGKPIDESILKVATEFEISFRRAQKLVHTEASAVSSQAREDCMKDLSVEEFEYVATLDERTCEVCQPMDGQHFKMSEFKIGLNAPPLHSNCRCVTAPYFADSLSGTESRTARDSEGNSYEVDDKLSYTEWKKNYVK